MASGIINGTTSNKYIDSKIEWSSSPSTANNNSVVTASLYYRRNNTYSGTPTSGNGTFGITIDGQSGSTTFSLTIPNSGAWVKAVTVTKTVPHNSDGQRSITISASGSIPVASLTSTTCSGTAVLDNIPRQGELTSAPDFTDLDNPTIYYKNPAGNSVTSLQVCISLTQATDDIKYRDISKTGTSYTFNLTDAERDLLRNNTTSGSRKVHFFIRTKIGNNTFHASKEVTLTIKETANTKPTVTMAATLDNGSLPSQFSGLYIQGKSKLQVELAAIGKYSAIIKSYYATLDGKTYNSAKFTTDVMRTASTISLVGYAKDSREFIGSTSQSFNVLPYSKPLVIPIGTDTAIQCYRSDGNGKRVGNSTSVWIKAKRNYQTVTSNGVQKNFCALQWRRKLVNESWNDSTHPWKDLISKTNTTITEYNAMLPSTVFELTKSYTVQIRAIDDVGEKDVKTFEIPTQDVALHLGKGGKNVSVGTYCDYSKDYTFYSDWDVLFDKNASVGESLSVTKSISVGGSQMADFIVARGTSGIWTYEKWASGKAECWAKYSYTVEDLADIKKDITVNQSFPFTFTSLPTCNLTLANQVNWNHYLSSCDFTKVQFTKFSIYRGGSGSTVEVSGTADIRVIGKWK
jgi:hypothetical protein